MSVIKCPFRRPHLRTWPLEVTILQVRYLVGIEPYDKSCAGCDVAVIAENTMDITFDTVRFVFVERQPCQNLVLK